MITAFDGVETNRRPAAAGGLVAPPFFCRLPREFVHRFLPGLARDFFGDFLNGERPF